MTNREAIEQLKLLHGFKTDIWRKERDQYKKKKYGEEVEALDLAIAALEKQEPVRPTDIRNYGDKDKVGFCPVCRVGANSYMKYCEECGQRLNWTEDAG